MKIAVLQMTAGIKPVTNTGTLVDAVHAAKSGGARILFTPEMSGLLDGDAVRAAPHVVAERENQVLCDVTEAARNAGIWVHLGSLALSDDTDGMVGEDFSRTRWVNRCLVIDDHGNVVARYDKIHLFDVELATGESWYESKSYRGGIQPVCVTTPIGLLGLSICYDLRFPTLYQALSAGGASVLAVPAAFTIPTGKAHWHVLLRARAIENASFVVAAAQVGHHEDGRETYGHSLVVDPWGRTLLDMGETPGLAFCEIDTDVVEEIRGRVPVIRHRRPIPPPLVV